MRIIIFLASLVLIFSCKQEVAEVEETPDAALEHLVFFSLKDGLSNEDVLKFKDLLKTLEDIKGVSEVEVSKRTDVGDSRALDYDLLMIIEFEAISYLKTYAEDPYHLMVRDSLMPYLAAPPATFDMIPD